MEKKEKDLVKESDDACAAVVYKVDNVLVVLVFDAPKAQTLQLVDLQ